MEQVLPHKKEESYELFNHIAPNYDFLNRLLSAGVDRSWRKKLLTFLPKRKQLKVLDLATGTADLALAIAKSEQVESVTGLDLSSEMIRVGRKKVAEKNLCEKITLEIGDGVSIPKCDNKFDVVTISFGIRNFPNVEESLRNCLRVLKKGGRLIILEFGLPKNAFLKTPYMFYFRHVLPTVGGIFSGNYKAYRYLNKSVEFFPYGKEFVNLIEKAGFKTQHCIPLSGGIAYLYVADKEPV